MNLEYADIFARRGHLYHRAMAAAPTARRAEFDCLFDLHPVHPGQTLLDVPAGGGYLARHLGAEVSTTSRELTAGFSDDVAVLEDADWRLGAFDHAVCLAALHHIDDQMGFLGRLGSHLAAGGVLHIADVAAGSPHAEFLDRFVGRYNETGHEGRYLRRNALPLPAGMRLRRAEDLACPWRFRDVEQLLAFCADLFGLVDCPPTTLRSALDDLVGIAEDEGGVALQWRLTYVDMQAA